MLRPTSKTLSTGTAQPTLNAVVSIWDFDARSAARRRLARTRRTEDISERTKDATVARLWPQERAAADTVKEVHAGVGWHRFNRDMPAYGARQAAYGI
jgi:hypothetical protein